MKKNINAKGGATGLFAKNARPKTINVMLVRSTSGNYHIKCAEYLDEVNQYKASWRKVDTRNLASELKRAAIGASMLTVN
jgi:hypothetical protein